MRRVALVMFCLVLVAGAAVADRMHPISRSHMQPPGSTTPGMPAMSGQSVGGKVISVDGTTITLAGDVKIDASAATIASDPGGAGTVAAIVPGSMIFAVLKPGDVAAGTPLPAAFIGVTIPADVYLTGSLQSVDTAAKTLTLLGITVTVNSSTVFAGHMGNTVIGLADLAAGDDVVVEANASGNTLVARAVYLRGSMSPQQQMNVFRGTVKSISTTSWVVTDSSKNQDVTVGVDADTKIVGDPVVGDMVNVVAFYDGSNALVARVIVKASSMVPPGGGNQGQMTMRGTVKSIAATSWIITVDGMMMGGHDIPVTVNSSTVITGSPAVGDHVEVVVQMTQGSLVPVAVSITKI